MSKWIMAFLLSVASIMGVVILFMRAGEHSSTQQQAAAAPAIPSVTLNADAATATYKQSCVACHGDQLEGKIGPNLQKIGTKLTVEQIYKQVQNGGGGMPAFKGTIKDVDIANLAQWLEQHK